MLIIQSIVFISKIIIYIMPSIIKLRGKGVSRIINSKVMMSPLAGVTDKIFRKLVRKWAPDSLFFTEMINATSLKHGYGTQKIKQLELEKGPVGVQILSLIHISEPTRPY